MAEITTETYEKVVKITSNDSTAAECPEAAIWLQQFS